ncbi:MAG: hypothetical protein NVS4B8_27700 [Herpetosiphon sp.]
MHSSRSNVIAQLAQTPTILNNLTQTLPAVALDHHPHAADWSVREILAHLVDDEMYVMRTRLERIIKEDLPKLAPHDEQHWYRNRNTTRDVLPELLSDFQVQREASLGILQSLRETDWQREGSQPEYGTFTAATWLHRWLEHDLVHIAQIQSNVEHFHSASHATT